MFDIYKQPPPLPQMVYPGEWDFYQNTFIPDRWEIVCTTNIEKPQVYMLARCPATDLQLAYVDTRLEDIKYVKFDFNFLDSTFLLKK